MSPPPSSRVLAGAAPSYTELCAVGAERPSGPPGARRKMMFVFAVVVLAQIPVDWLAGGELPWTITIRLVWALCLLFSAQRPGEDESQLQFHAALQSTVAILSYIALVLFTGGRQGPYFSFFPSVPLLLALIYPHSALAALIGGTLGGVGVVTLVLWEGGALSQALLWAGMVATATGMGAYGSHQFRIAQQAKAEAQLERTRREALEQLAISERRRAQSEKLAAIGQLAACVMHEINNPLAFVRSNLDFLAHQVLTEPEPSREELAEVFSETHTGVERIHQIVSDLKGFSHMGQEELAECSLAEVVEDATRLARLRLKHLSQLEVDIPADVPPVLAIHRRLAQVLLNLLVNAGDAMERGQKDAKLRVTARREGARVLLLVEDNGPGFPLDVLPRLFETFFTTKGPEKGTGLGLALSREMVEQFGGTLVAENREEGGARLRIELPVHAPGAPVSAAA